MSKWHQGRRRNESLRALASFKVNRVWNENTYRVRPRGFDTILFEIMKPDHVAEADFRKIMDAVVTLSDLPVKR